MKTKKIRNLVKKARAELSWQVMEVQQESGTVHILSDPIEKTHYIFLPPETDETDPYRELLYLHELGHALMSERVHPFFGSVYPIVGLEERQGPAVRPVLNAVGDWFVGHWLTDFCPELADEELQKEFAATTEMLQNEQSPSVEKYFVAALIIAQSVKYLRVPDNCDGFLKKTVRAFLDVPPENPSVEKFELLINRLLALGAPLRCRRTSNQEGRDLLEFYPGADAAAGQASSTDQG
jgi:hypothetical protein